MWKGDFLCVGTFLGFKNHQAHYYLGNRSILRNHFEGWQVVVKFDFNDDNAYFFEMRWGR